MPIARLRIVVALLWLTSPAMWASPRIAGMPITTVPWGASWMVPGMDPTMVGVARAIVVVGALLGLVGLGSRLGFGLVTFGGLFVLGVSQFHGAVQHHHHLLWFSALLAVSPSSDALSIRRWKPAKGHSLAWGLPVRASWAILAAIYFFPGLHKIRVQGWDWAGENLIHLLHWKWAQSWHFEPISRIDHWPNLLWIGGLAVLVFEISAPFAMLHRWTRWLFAAAMLVFHAGTALWFDIRFEALLVCGVVLLPAKAVGGAHLTFAGVKSWLPLAVVGTVLGVGIGWTGLTGRTQAWPFACYPTFDQPAGEWMPTLAVVPDGREPLAESMLADDGQQFYAEIWGVLGLYDNREPRGVEAFWSRARIRPEVSAALRGTTSVTLFRASRNVDPDDPVLRLEEAIATFPVADSRY